MISRKNNLILTVPICLVLVFSLNFQRHKRETDRSQDLHPSFHELKSLNDGQPYRFEGPRCATDQVLVKFRPTLTEQSAESIITAYNSNKITRIPRLGVYKVRIPEGTTVEEMVYALRLNPDVEYAEPNPIARITVTPNDTYFSYQYALYNSGQRIGVPGSPSGKARADIKATAAWEETKGTEDVTIAVLDTGLDLNHPDLKNKLASSGRDFVNDDFDATDDHGHGTHVAGIAAAETNNNEGVAGVAWDCKILPVKVLDEDGSGYYDWIIQGILWAVDNGAAVINLSLGGDAHAQSMRDAVKYAYDKGVVVVASAGNDAGAVLYPAAYDSFVLAVAATDYNDERPDWSNFGAEVDVAAPGERIVGCVPTWYFGPNTFPYGFGSGTSQAAPHVSGLAALLKSLKPWLRAGEVMDVIRFSADDVNASEYSGKDEYIGYGRINAEKALVPIKVK